MDFDDEPVYNSLLEPGSVVPKEKKKSQLPGVHLMAMALLVAFGGSFSFGYQLVITNPAQDAFIDFVNRSLSSSGKYYELNELESIWGGIISLFFWGSTCGSLFISIIVHKLGRKNGLQLSHFIHILSCLLSIASYQYVNHRLYAFSRFLIGFAFSISLGVAPMFIAECSPKHCRGKISMTTGVLLQIGLVVGAVTAMPHVMGNKEYWWMMYGVEAVLTCIVALIMPLVKESPGYLLSRQHITECEQSIKFYHEVTSESAQEIIEEMKKEKDSSCDSYGLFEIWKFSSARRGTILGIVIMITMVMTGIAAINAFAFEILLSTGLTVRQASYGNILICFMSVVGIICSSLVIDYFGRRRLLLVTYSLLGLINIMIYIFMIGYERTQNSVLGYCLLTAISLFNLTFAAGPGPISLFVTSELVSQRARGPACTWVQAAMSICRSFLLAGYLPLKNSIGQPQAYFFLFFPPMIITVIVLYFYLPETKGKTVTEVEDSVKLLPTIRRKT
ncbi:unnamed protein product [Auanema sp. JU1783]|nr:unnamed protein product [Auanema sp. JU1783]